MYGCGSRRDYSKHKVGDPTTIQVSIRRGYRSRWRGYYRHEVITKKQDAKMWIELTCLQNDEERLS